RTRLQVALGRLIKLKPRDLPSEVSEDFADLVSGISRFPVKHVTQEIRAAVDVLSNAQVMDAISRIMRMYDAVSAYQPLPVKHPGGVPCRSLPAHWASTDYRGTHRDSVRSTP
ncbi:hypothetical protein, partial [Noviherbaspirillum denitrificans]|uniref:hypothetical protein n=1 Tax=Noviherbaspirillum denitrificans TaxID=1968433 RepID=UPI0019822520